MLWCHSCVCILHLRTLQRMPFQNLVAWDQSLGNHGSFLGSYSFEFQFLNSQHKFLQWMSHVKIDFSVLVFVWYDIRMCCTWTFHYLVMIIMFLGEDWYWLFVGDLGFVYFWCTYHNGRVLRNLWTCTVLIRKFGLDFHWWVWIVYGTFHNIGIQSSSTGWGTAVRRGSLEKIVLGEVIQMTIKSGFFSCLSALHDSLVW